MIETIKLTKEFGSIRAVDHLSFKVEKGEVLGFLGPNGAGKSTTMKMLTCFLTPTSGTAKVGGHDIIENSMAVRKLVGYLPETAPAYGEMSVRGFLNFIAEIRGFGGSAKRKAVGDVIESCFLTSVEQQTVETLSKGYKRRVGLAQAIIHNPPALIMDEPTDGLDPNQKYEVRSLIQRMARDKVIILSTHILEEVDAVCTRAVIIGDGRLLADGSPSDLKRRSRHHNAVLLTVRGAGSADQAREALARAPHVASVDFRGESGGLLKFMVYPVGGLSIAPGLADLARERKWDLVEFHVEEGRLDEVFRDLTQAARAAAPVKARAVSRDEDEDDDDEDDEDDDEDDEDDDEDSDDGSAKGDDDVEADEDDAPEEVAVKAAAPARAAAPPPTVEAPAAAKPQAAKPQPAKPQPAKPQAAKPQPARPEPARSPEPPKPQACPGGGGGASKAKPNNSKSGGR